MSDACVGVGNGILIDDKLTDVTDFPAALAVGAASIVATCKVIQSPFRQKVNK